MRTTASSPPTLDSQFPDGATNLLERDEHARLSRRWAGIYVPTDNEMGALCGAMIGRLVGVRAWEDRAAQAAARHVLGCRGQGEITGR